MVFAMRNCTCVRLTLSGASTIASRQHMRAAGAQVGYMQPIRYQIVGLIRARQAMQRSAIDKRQLCTAIGTLGRIASKGRLIGSRAAYSTESKKPTEEKPKQTAVAKEHHEKVLTIPNALTMARILSSPYIGYLIVQQRYGLALTGCVVFGLTDALDGYIARKYNMMSFVGSIIDPAADKVLMTTLTVALAYSGLLPTALAVVIIGRDVALSLAAFFIRWATLPAPKTLKRYFDLSIPSVEVRPTRISKWNTALQLSLMAATLTSPVFGIPVDHAGLVALQWITGTTTVLSGIGYLTSKDAVHRLTKAEVAKRIPKPPHILPSKKQQK